MAEDIADESSHEINPLSASVALVEKQVTGFAAQIKWLVYI